MLKKQGFEVYLLDEFERPRAVLTAAIRWKKSRRSYRRTKCTNQKCKHDHGYKLWNRDLAAVLNFRKILFGHRENNERPTLFKRKRAEAEASSSKIPKHS
ncbi:uncharacterized protein BYT42DRAFT_585570 [Radiomyces spectabilis]|uniref:uncharacterized protein n=1 Tax=Radiomyces spectabilis TaxID=64574 RepID=UPI00221F8E54|nr:uncharacterized protein BYT42DRAFT_585570 [Radiomyces spectabilis]KAI8368171.1 hypothetical protein BYT42DRAFT_585570 [Radiomyces spectabilis]